MNPIILIPARLQSARLPGKPLAMIGDAPMIVQVMRRAQEAALAEVVVGCDGPEIAEAVERAGGKAVITDAALPSGSDRIFAALQAIDPEKKHDIIINVQGDMPLLDPAILQAGLRLMENPEVDIATLAAPLVSEEEKADPAVVKVVVSPQSLVDSNTNDFRLTTNDFRRALSFSRRMPDSGEAFHHIGIYFYRREALEKFVRLPQSASEKKERLEQLRAMDAGMAITVAVVDTVPLGVDTEEGLEKARELYGKK